MQNQQVEAVTAAAKNLGNQAILARALGITPVTVGQWLKPERAAGRAVPPKQCVRIEQLTKGAVTRRQLRPNDWQEIWPELALAPVSATDIATNTVASAIEPPNRSNWDGIEHRDPDRKLPEELCDLDRRRPDGQPARPEPLPDSVASAAGV